MASASEIQLLPNMNVLDYALLPPTQQAALVTLPGSRLVASMTQAAPPSAASVRHCQLMYGSCDVSAAPACAEFAGEWRQTMDGAQGITPLITLIQCCRGAVGNGSNAKPGVLQCSYENHELHGYIEAQVGCESNR
jgi:hypothetical protein